MQHSCRHGQPSWPIKRRKPEANPGQRTVAPGADAVCLVDDDARQQAVAVQRAAGREADNEVVGQGRSLKGDMQAGSGLPGVLQQADELHLDALITHPSSRLSPSP